MFTTNFATRVIAILQKIFACISGNTLRHREINIIKIISSGMYYM